MNVSEELQRLLFTTLKADAGVAAITSRVYDHVPRANGQVTAEFPHISFGPQDATDAGGDCIDGQEITIQLDCWSRAVGSLECKNMVDAVRRALHERELELTDNALAEIRVFLTRVFRDPDGLTTHGVVQVTASVEIPE